MECFYAEKNNVLQMGIVNFYNIFSEKELFIISRDNRFFIRDNCTKNLCFITTDETDLKDREVLSMLSNRDEFNLLGNKADIILTQNKKLAEKNRKYVYWVDREFQEKFIFVNFPWEYGYGRRLNQRMLGMAEALASIGGKENSDRKQGL